MTISEMIDTLRAAQVNDSGIRAALAKQGYSEEDILEALPKTARRTFASEFYDWLAEAERADEDVEAFILGTGEYGETSKNVQNHLSHYKNIANLANRIHRGA